MNNKHFFKNLNKSLSTIIRTEQTDASSIVKCADCELVLV